MVDRKDIDLIVVTTKVQFHRELVLGALAADKHVFCEWPLGLNTAEAAELFGGSGAGQGAAHGGTARPGAPGVEPRA